MSGIAIRNGYWTRHSPVVRAWVHCHTAVRAFASHPDPLAEAGNWVALTIGSHLPLWPLYVCWAAGWDAWPSALLTAAMTPLFLAVPLIARRSSLYGRLAMLVFGITNTLFTMWVLGVNSGTEVFLVPCAVLAALIFRSHERLWMLALTMTPLIVWCVLQQHPMARLNSFDATVGQELFVLNVCSIGLLIAVFGWLQVDIYRRMEAADIQR